MRGVAAKARARLQRSSRIGREAGTTPVGKPTTTVTPWFQPRLAAAKKAVVPSVRLDAHGVVAPAGPA